MTSENIGDFDAISDAPSPNGEMAESDAPPLDSSIASDSQSLEAQSEQDLKQRLEAVIFASDEAVPNKLIRVALDDESLSDERIADLIAALNREYEETGRTFRIHRIAQGYRFLTEKQFHRPIQRLLQPKLARRLSQAALETLAIIAYKQPVTKAEIEAIRGTNADYVIRILLEKNLIEVCGRSEGVGKPLLYGTTKEFLDYFNLPSLSELPKPREIDELMREDDAQEFLKQELNSRLKVELERDVEADASKARESQSENA
ncbi:MAG: SMC-Scp complex subunit ScpB [Chloroherpetonaceae bacterium]|nr:SMC-Scp complex subunit ScpB [Chloroherpetonaceae bacterium]MDW8438335.1 SMC-Scp complex subunit ScpB [Chloroherpetonaceae bacterium]